MRLAGFLGALALVGAVGWWMTSTPATRVGVVASVASSALVLVGKSIAVRRSIQVALDEFVYNPIVVLVAARGQRRGAT